MKIIQRSLTQQGIEDNEDRDKFDIVVDGVEEIRVCDYGKPEDNSLCRDLDFVYHIVPLMKRAYEAGKNNEEFEIVEERVDNL